MSACSTCANYLQPNDYKDLLECYILFQSSSRAGSVVVGVGTVLLAGVVIGVLLDSLVAVLELADDAFLGFLGARFIWSIVSWLARSFRRLSSSEIFKTGSSLFFRPSCFLLSSSSHFSLVWILLSSAFSSVSVYLEGSPAAVSFFSCSVDEIRNACACTSPIRKSLTASARPAASLIRLLGAAAARLKGGKSDRLYGAFIYRNALTQAQTWRF